MHNFLKDPAYYLKKYIYNFKIQELYAKVYFMYNNFLSNNLFNLFNLLPILFKNIQLI